MQKDNRTIIVTHSRLLALLLLPFLITACDSSSSSSSGDGGLNVSEWLINESEVVDGGPGIDGIPSIDDPEFGSISENDTFRDDRRIAAMRVGDELLAFPHQIMDHHEIVNHEVDGTPVGLTFCPLTGTSIGVEKRVGGSVLEYGVSGLLFRNNLIMYDRNTGSTWSQMQLRSVGGEFSGSNVETIQVIETSWATWKEMYPESKVLTRDTGFGRNYNTFLYGSDYTTNHNRILFPIKNEDNRLQRKERVHALLPENANEDSEVKAYPIKEFGSEMTIVTDQFNGDEFLLVGNSSLDLMNSFKLTTDFEQSLSLEPVNGELPVVMVDQHGNRWDIFGVALEGPNQGERLTKARGYTGYWFALADFYPGIELYEE
ncbi:MAG: DUF3179 domain-containing protein [Bacteroidetes bacterium]|jgi:hypothetical protein|nr:DUF3179 domain-containing protein [Bacteroidota bacterium]